MITVAHRRPELVGAFDGAVGVLLFRHQQLDADPQQQQCPDDLEVGNRQQGKREEDQDDAQDDGTRRPPEDAEPALGRIEPPAGEGDDHRVVAAEQDVDHDDLADGNPELGR